MVQSLTDLFLLYAFPLTLIIMALLIAVPAKKTGPPPLYAHETAQLPQGVIQLTRGQQRYIAIL
jgi:hypothetical protein